MTYIIQAEVDQRWFRILGLLSENQDGFIWLSVKQEEVKA